MGNGKSVLVLVISGPFVTPFDHLGDVNEGDVWRMVRD